VIDHRLSLAEAARHYHQLNQGCADFNWQRFRESWPGANDEARCFGQVLQMVEGELSQQPREARTVRARLKEEWGSAALRPDAPTDGSRFPQ
jgi:hypothetical protein